MRVSFNVGNVLKTKSNGIIIITKHRRSADVYEWISFSHQNCIGSTKYNTRKIESVCYNLFDGDVCDAPDCIRCNGTGKYYETVIGLEEAEFLGNNVEDYLMRSLSKILNLQ